MIRHVFLVTCIIGALLGSTGCGSGSCKSACRKIAKCMGIDLDATADESGWTCTLSTECSPLERCKARCINKASCPAITGEDGDGQQTLADCQSTCEQTAFDGGIDGDLGIWDLGDRDAVDQDLGGQDLGGQDLGTQDLSLPDGQTPDPDLVMTLFDASVSGSTVTFTAEFCNDGASTSSTFYLKLFYHRSYAPGCSDSADDYETIYGLAAGECESYVFSRTSTPAGNYTAWAKVDANCSVTEPDESNNHQSTYYTVSSTSLPDLELTSFTSQVSGTTVVFEANVCNNGDSTSSTFTLGLFYNATSNPGCSNIYSDSKTIYGLSKGACNSYTFTRYSTPAGTHNGWLVVDTGCVISESSESNNSAYSSYTVSSTPCTPTTTYDFDDATMQGITETGTDSTVRWHVSGNRYHGGAYSLRYADPTANNFAGAGTNSGEADLPAVTIPSSGTSTLTFWLWADVEASASYDILYVKVGGTSVWSKTESNITYQSWNQISVDLSASKGQTIFISFEFATNDGTSNSGEGMYIDEVELSLGCP